MAQLLDRYYESLSSLTKDLTANLQAIGAHDQKCHNYAVEVDKKMRLLIKSHKKMPKSSAATLHQEIMASLLRKLHFIQQLNLFGEIDQESNEKVRLSSEMYELVDKHIRRLDSESAKLQASMRQKYLEAVAEQTKDEPNEKKRKSSAGRKDKKKVKEESWNSKASTPFLDAQPVVEMPVDPNEPTYCICHQVSYGEMVMCDNKHCPIEWFHFQCVGLSESPKGKWYCERCTESRKKKGTGSCNK